jgi:hypothetical protein
MLERAEGRGGARLAQPADLLASLLLFYARDGLVGLRRPADLAAWWDLWGEGSDGPAAADLQRDHPALSAALATAADAAERLVGVPASALVTPPRGRAVRRSTALRLQNWSGAGDRDQVASETVLIGALLAPRDKWRGWLSRNVFPAPARLRKMYGLGEGARVRLAFWRLAHPVKVSVRIALALFRAYGSSRRRQLETWSPVG